MSYFTHITSTVVITKPYKRQQNITTMAVGNWTNFVSFSLGFVSQATKQQSVQPILFYSFPIMFTLLLSAKLHLTNLPIMLQNFLVRSETKMVCNKIGLMI